MLPNILFKENFVIETEMNENSIREKLMKVTAQTGGIDVLHSLRKPFGFLEKPYYGNVEQNRFKIRNYNHLINFKNWHGWIIMGEIEKNRVKIKIFVGWVANSGILFWSFSLIFIYFILLLNRLFIINLILLPLLIITIAYFYLLRLGMRTQKEFFVNLFEGRIQN